MRRHGSPVYGRYDSGKVPDTVLPVHRRVFRLLKAAGKEFGHDMATRFAAALSFYTLFSLVPLLFLLVAVVGFVSSDSRMTRMDCETVSASAIPPTSSNPLDRAVLQVREVAGDAVADPIAELTCQASDNAGQALGIGILLAAFSGSSIFLHIQGVLNFIFQVPKSETKGLANLLLQRAIALLWAILLSVVVFVPILAVGAVNFVQDLVDVRWLQNVISLGVPLTSLIILVVVVGLTFQLLVKEKIPWQAARRGGLFTAIVGLVGAFGVGFYLRNFGGGGALGAVGGAAILLFFFNLMWVIYLFGAEVTKVYADYLVNGDVLSPSERQERQRREARERAVAAAANGSGTTSASGSVLAFLVGVVTGWLARQKNK